MSLVTSCDSYLDIEPKGRTLLESTDDYLGLIEEISPTYDHAYSLNICNEASWYKTEELKNYTTPLRSVGFLWDDSYDRAAVMVENELYNNCYSRITNYNVIVSNIDKAKGPEEDKLLAMAQAKIMRAYNYFFLVNTFAAPYDPATADQTSGIIVREKMFESIEEKGVQQSVGYTYRFIQQDIDDAIADLPHIALNAFRPDRTFGYALKAKVHLYKREIDECITACLAALDEAPAGKHELWDMNTEYSRYAPQLLMAYGTDRAIDRPEYMGLNDAIESIWKNGVQKSYDAPENLIYQFGTTYTDPFPMYLSSDVIDLFDHQADLRELFCLRYRRTHETAPEGHREYASMGIRWNPSGMRLSEVYLMLAECYARKGSPSDIAKAMDYLDTLRSRRNIKTRYTRLTTTDAAEALRFVREERKRELFLTYNGFFDLRRFAIEFNETQTKVFDGETYTLSSNSTLLTFPFPLKAMQTSDLKQNSK
ncbi:MAG: RagB/SusD family nutrient uptake outer membrane protein [Duncaniella sp.]|nr:RagB/SusD family nutrient uptake outer membrane protein [Duncaniella sp.]